MERTATPSAIYARREAHAAGAAAPPPRRFLARVRLGLSGIVAGALGVAPHVLHHAGPLAGAALFAGVGGTLVFGALGFVAAIPLLLRMRRRTGGWRAPASALALFAIVFSVSSFVVGPAIAGDDGPDGREPAAPARAVPAGHDEHH